MKQVKVKCPAKINLTLEIVNKREDGFHNINSIMQLISLCDYLTMEYEAGENNEIYLSGNSDEIPYDKTNLVYKAAELFLQKTGIQGAKIKINIDKNIPVSAGLAGGSTDAAGTILGLNELLNKPLSKNNLHELCSLLGSDLNVCLEGGCLLATSRGEKISKLPASEYSVTLIKPRKLGISAKEAYTKYSEKILKPKYNKTELMCNALKAGQDIREYLYNDLEYAVFDDYKELQYIKSMFPNAVMSGSGSAYFILENLINVVIPDNFEVINNLKFIPHGCMIL